MLYVSRRMENGIGVVDTDDGSEEFWYGTEVATHVLDGELKVEGVTTTLEPSTGRLVSLISPYQLPEQITPLQTKLKLLYGVDVTVWNGMITSIFADFDRISVPVTVRPSDFGTCCSDHLLGCIKPARCHKLTIVLDDKVSWTRRSFTTSVPDFRYFPTYNRYGVVFDVREVTNKKLTEFIYSRVYCGRTDEFWTSIVDTEKSRKRVLGKMEVHGFSSLGSDIVFE